MALLLVAGCGDAADPSLSVQGSPEGTPASDEPSLPVEDLSDGVEVSVALWHCGVESVTLEGRVWEVPDTETVDGHPDLPLDSTNTPTDWVGRGTAAVAEDEMTYTDEGGEVVRFVPDDGRPPGPCA
jgi:hypothetical protein